MRPLHALALPILLALSACGGGGDGGGGEFTMSAAAAAFTAVEHGAAPPAQTFTVTVTGAKAAYLGAGYTSGAQPPAWLGVELLPGGGRDWTLRVSILPTTLAAGTYTDTFQVGTADADGRVLATRNFTVTFVVTPGPPRLVADRAAVVLGGADGLGAPTGSLTVRLEGGSAATCDYAAEASTATGGPWLVAAPATGRVTRGGVTLTLSAGASVAPGTYQGVVQVRCTAGGQPLLAAASVTLNVEAHRLVVAAAGVGLSSTPSRAVLSRDLAVRSSLGRPGVGWTASSDQPWLTVTASGDTSGALHLSADPAGLAAGETHFAVVEVRADDPSVENVEQVRVGLAVRDADAGAASVALAAGHLAASPVEPVIFASAGTGVVGLDAWTGAAVRTFAGVAVSAGELAVSGDGSRLYLLDGGLTVLELDAVTGDVLRTWPLGSTGWLGGGLTWLRTGAVPVLVTRTRRAYDLSTLAELPDLFPFSMALTPSLEGDRLVDERAGVYTLHRSALAGGRTWAAPAHGPFGYSGAAAGGACIEAGGARLLLAQGAPYEFVRYETMTWMALPSLPAAPYPNAVACAWNGLVVGGASAYYDPVDVWVYDGPTGARLAALSSTAATSYRSLVTRGLAISADGTRLATTSGAGMGLSNGNEVRLQQLPAPPPR